MLLRWSLGDFESPWNIEAVLEAFGGTTQWNGTPGTTGKCGQVEQRFDASGVKEVFMCARYA